MKVISFHLKGKMAHFRKFYSNSSALSYFIPPRTTICGIIAGILGIGRDEYYDDFSLDNCKVALASLKPTKKSIQKLNYLMVKSSNDLNGSQEHHSQTPTELIIPQNIRTGFIDYKIWVYHKKENIMTKLIDILKNQGCFYKSLGACMALGSAFNLGWIEFDGEYEGIEVKGLSDEPISSSVPVEKIKDIKLEKIQGTQCKLIKEEVPLEFDKDRCITSRGLKEVLTNIDGGSIPAVVDSFIRLNNKEIIVWME